MVLTTTTKMLNLKFIAERDYVRNFLKCSFNYKHGISILIQLRLQSEKWKWRFDNLGLFLWIEKYLVLLITCYFN